MVDAVLAGARAPRRAGSRLRCARVRWCVPRSATGMKTHSPQLRVDAARLLPELGMLPRGQPRRYRGAAPFPGSDQPPCSPRRSSRRRGASSGSTTCRGATRPHSRHAAISRAASTCHRLLLLGARRTDEPHRERFIPTLASRSWASGLALGRLVVEPMSRSMALRVRASAVSGGGGRIHRGERKGLPLFVAERLAPGAEGRRRRAASAPFSRPASIRCRADARRCRSAARPRRSVGLFDADYAARCQWLSRRRRSRRHSRNRRARGLIRELRRRLRLRPRAHARLGSPRNASDWRAAVYSTGRIARRPLGSATADLGADRAASGGGRR